MEAVTNNNMTYKTFSRGLIVRLYMIFFHVSDHTVQNLFILFHSQNTFSVINDGVGSSCIKACDSATLARDLKVLCAEDYELVRVSTTDMFPQGVHVESVVLMSKVEK